MAFFSANFVWKTTTSKNFHVLLDPDPSFHSADLPTELSWISMRNNGKIKKRSRQRPAVFSGAEPAVLSLAVDVNVPPLILAIRQVQAQVLDTKQYRTVQNHIISFKIWWPTPPFLDIYFIYRYRIGTILRLMRRRLIHTIFRLGFACAFVG